MRSNTVRAGVSVSYLSEIEKGKKYPKTEKLIEKNCDTFFQPAFLWKFWSGLFLWCVPYFW